MVAGDALVRLGGRRGGVEVGYRVEKVGEERRIIKTLNDCTALLDGKCVEVRPSDALFFAPRRAEKISTPLSRSQLASSA